MHARLFIAGQIIASAINHKDFATLDEWDVDDQELKLCKNALAIADMLIEEHERTNIEVKKEY